MPNGQSSYSAYREAGRSKGEYRASLQSIEDVLTQREFKRERGAIRSEKTERTLDTLMAMIETGSTLYGGYLDKQEFEGYLGDLSEIKGPYQKVGKEGNLWGEMSWWDKMWQEPKYKFGEDVLGKEDITIMAKMKKYGMDIETDYPITETSPGGKYITAETGDTTTFESQGDISMLEETEVDLVKPDIPNISYDEAIGLENLDNVKIEPTEADTYAPIGELSSLLGGSEIFDTESEEQIKRRRSSVYGQSILNIPQD